ncbi:MAG TPA: ABC transporter permease [Nitrospira sp.]|uniref:ABC transporter permease n=1 Tax=Cognatazoarcus halotolerans TaxID=2686016 RepID=UPI00190FA04F|nr:ABC transporter permease [Cognatazoarcus halotolerans]MCB1902101.1 ABC transporter permease [Rhodocyclaceae bacterium]HQV11199.1 ABC transporter permease [Nitrospira sp.]
MTADPLIEASKSNDVTPRLPRTSLDVTLSVWRALFLREGVARLAAGRAAWLWLLFQPIVHVVFLMVVFSTLRSRVLSGTDFAVFLALGVMGYHMFRNPTTRCMNAVNANRALFAYRQVKPVDAVIVRALLEGFIEAIVFLLVIAGAAFVGMDAIPHDPLRALLGVCLLWVFGFGLGLVFSVGNELIPEIGRIVTLMLTPLYFMSGVMFSPAALPPAARDWLLLNPIMHGLEYVRSGFFPGYHLTPGVDIEYLATFAFVSVFFGLALHVRFEKRLVAL